MFEEKDKALQTFWTRCKHVPQHFLQFSNTLIENVKEIAQLFKMRNGYRNVWEPRLGFVYVEGFCFKVRVRLFSEL